jgi:dienelactone hydrolase
MSSLVVTLLLATVGQATPAPDTTGPHPVTPASNVMVSAGGRMVEAAVFTPSDRVGAPFPIVIIGHGFARTNANVAGHAAHLASWGMVVVAPNFPSRFAPDHALNGQIMRDLLAWARTGPAPIGAIVDARRSAYVGHSAGGLAAFLAAGSDPTVSALVGLDPVDNAGAGAGAAPRITAPTLVLGAVSNRCNANASADGLYAALTVPSRWFLRVANATHCDAEDPTNALCTGTCGGEDPARRALFRRYMTAHLRAVLDCEATSWVPGGAGLMADVGRAVVGELDAPGRIGCAGPGVDAGAPPLLDAGTSPGDAGTTPADAAPVAPDAAPVGADAAPAPLDATTDADATTTAPDAAAPSLDAGVVGDDAATAAADASAAPDAGSTPAPTLPRAESGCTTVPASTWGLWAVSAVVLASARRRRAAR